MPPKNEIKEITKIAHSSVQQYFSNAARRKALQANPNAPIAEGGRGSSRKKAKITTNDVVVWSAANNNNTIKKEKREVTGNDQDDLLLEDDNDDEEEINGALLEDDDDEWETVVVASVNKKSSSGPSVKKEELAKQEQNRNEKIEPDTNNSDTRTSSVANNTDDFGVARALQKFHAQLSRQRVISSCCSLLVLRIAQGKWMRDKVASNGKLSLILRHHPRLQECFKEINQIFAATEKISKKNVYDEQRNLNHVGRNVEGLRPTWLSLSTPSPTQNNNKDDANLPLPIVQALAVIAKTMKSIFEIELPSPTLHSSNANQNEDDARKGKKANVDDGKDDDDEFEDVFNRNNMMMMMPQRRQRGSSTKNQNEKSGKQNLETQRQQSAKRFCDLNEIIHIPPPFLLAPFVQTAVKAGKNQFGYDAELEEDGIKNNCNNNNNSDAGNTKNKVLHSCWWTLLFAAICNASRHLSDFRICVGFDLFICHQLERAKFGRFGSSSGGKNISTFSKWSEQADQLQQEDSKLKVKKEESSNNKNTTSNKKVKKNEDDQDDEEDDDEEDEDDVMKKNEEENAKNNKFMKPQQTVWVELWHPERECYVPVTVPISFGKQIVEENGGKNNKDSNEKKKSIKAAVNDKKSQQLLEKEQKEINDLVGGPRWNAPYVLAFGRDGTVIDVSVKYTNSWSKIFPMRLDYMMRNHYSGELDASQEVEDRFVFSANRPDVPTPADIVAAIKSNTKTLSPLVINCEYTLPPNASWSDNLLAKLNKGKVTSRDLAYKLTRDRLQLHLLKYSGDPVPKTLSGIKSHPLYICETQIARHEAIFPKDLTTTVGLFRGAAVYRRTAVRPLRGVEGWLRLKRMMRSEDETPTRVCPPPPSRPLSRPSRLFGMWQTIPYQPLPLKEVDLVRNREGSSSSSSSNNDDDDDDEDDDDVLLLEDGHQRGPRRGFVIPTLNAHLDWYIILRGYSLPQGLTHFKSVGIRSVARKMNLEFATAVVGFEKQKDPTENNNNMDNNNNNLPLVLTNNIKVKPTRHQDTLQQQQQSTAEQFKNSRMQFQQRKPWKAVFEGIVVKTEDAARLRQAHREFLRVKELKERAKIRTRALHWWNVLISRRLAMERLANDL